MNYDKTEIGKRIRKMRKAAGFKSQSSFGAALKTDEAGDGKAIDRKTIARWEYGERLPDLDIMLQMCEMFNCDLDYLLGTLEVRTHDTKFIKDETGLTEEAIEELREYNKDSLIYYYRNPAYSGGSIEEYVLQFISYILTCDEDPDDPYPYGATTLETILDEIRNLNEVKKSLETYPPHLLDVCRRAYEDSANVSNVKTNLRDKYREFLLLNYGAYKEDLKQDLPRSSKEEILDLADSVFDFLEIEDKRSFFEFDVMQKMLSLIQRFTEAHDYLY